MLRPFQILSRLFGPAHLYLSNEGLYPGSKGDRKNRPRILTSSIKRHFGRFHVVVVQWTAKEGTKKRDARAELLFCS